MRQRTTSTAPLMPVDISVIIPAHNCGSQLAQCLSALKATKDSGTEIVVVDDASTDDTIAVAEQYGAKVIRMEINKGPAAARNRGVKAAKGNILFFIDADVCVASDAITRVRHDLENQPDIVALFGSYDDCPAIQNIVSKYRNLLHHYVHQQGSTNASTFWSGCGAVRRTAFEAVGGFDDQQYPKPSIEDIELGYRLRRTGGRILLDKQLYGKHLKAWRLFPMLRTDITCRAIPWARLMLDTEVAPNDLNLRQDQRISGALVTLALLLTPVIFFQPLVSIAVGLCLFSVIVINRHLYSFFAKKGGWVFGVTCISLHLLYYLYSTASYAYVLLGTFTGRMRNLRLVRRQVEQP